MGLFRAPPTRRNTKRVTKHSTQSIQLDINPDINTALDIINQTGTYMADAKPILQSFVPLLKAVWIENFSTEGSSINKSWPENKPRYLAQKVAEGFGHRKMVRKGRLLKQIYNTRVTRLAPYAVSVGFTGALARRAQNLQYKRGFAIAGISSRFKLEAEKVLEQRLRELLGTAISRWREAGGVVP